MVKIIGLTGGIGSGKTTVANIFEAMGVPVFNSDFQAKLQYQKKEVQQKVLEYFGEDLADASTGINFPKLARIIFFDQSKLNWINALIHPLVEQDFQKWKEGINSKIVVKESAILIESGGNNKCDYTVAVTADVEERINRVMARDGISKVEVQKRINKQMSEEQRNEIVDYVINNENELLIPQVLKIINELDNKQL